MKEEEKQRREKRRTKKNDQLTSVENMFFMLIFNRISVCNIEDTEANSSEFAHCRKD